MTPKKFMEFLKNIEKRIENCPSCGAKYQIEEVQFLGQVDGFLLLQMSCKKCHLSVWESYIVAKDSSVKQAFVQGSNKESFLEMPGINADELINFHNFMEIFDGNFRKAIR